MAGATLILIQIPKSRKLKSDNPLTAIVKENTVHKEVNLSPKQKKSNSWYEYVYNYRIKQCQQGREHTDDELEDHKTCVLINIKMLNKNLDVTSSNKALEQDYTTAAPPVSEEAGTKEAEVIKRYHIEVKFKKPAGIFCLNKKIKATIKVYPTVVSPFPDDPFMSAIDKTLTQLFSSKTHEINVKEELEKGCYTPSKKMNVSFVVADNTDVIISLRTVSVEV
ncbi:hypothetical protein PYW08_001962 [Mythimna loreyi]|uniref:Uncharacterized protein n=1 Tax=Mythimna loreyi TaxID=667449 RepID=A0ACC2R2S6_9NEOP|nr:hypothetical protein PYW08_001962 [Mythimna loreyi]